MKFIASYRAGEKDSQNFKVSSVETLNLSLSLRNCPLTYKDKNRQNTIKNGRK